MIIKYIEILKSIGFSPKTVLEIGSREANDARVMCDAFGIKNSDVYIVEPNPEILPRICCKEFNLFNVAIGLDVGVKKFHQVHGNDDVMGTSSLIERNDGWYERNNVDEIEVNVITGKELLKSINREIDICKIDVEGLTWEVLKSFEDTLTKIKTIHVETEIFAYWKNQKLHGEVVSLLIDRGYKMMWVGGDTQKDSVWIHGSLLNINDLEIHTLICKRDIILAINNFKSLCKFEEFSNLPIFLHDDGSLKPDDIEILTSAIKNVTVIDRKWADIEIAKYIENYPHCKSYRLGSNPINLWHKIKSFDYFFFSKTKKILGMDTDLLFMRKPEAAIELLRTNTPFYYPDNQNAYCFNEPKSEVPVLSNVNTGFIFIPSEEYYSLDALEFALSNLTRNGINYFPSWIEQSAFAHMFYKNGKYKSLPVDKYRFPYFQSIDSDFVECLHFVSYPPCRETYSQYTNYLKFDSGIETYNKNFTVTFEDKKIPLNVSIEKTENMKLVSYVWDIEVAKQRALDHFFKIEYSDGTSDIHKFQSSRTGFFFVSGKHASVKMFHTYDWYGKQSWELLDSILL